MRPRNVLFAHQSALMIALAAMVAAPPPEPEPWNLAEGNGNSGGAQWHRNYRRPNGRHGKKHFLKGVRP